ncbi:MAG: hypothetical protein JOZ02_23525 [Acidobacteria bacterium]|nr:hypothetical protein [Acidobacteriota bacterium]
MSECKAYRREIEEAADGGGLSPGARAHLALCRACGDEARGRESLRALVGGLGKVEAPADFEFRLRARMAASKSNGGGRFGGRWLYGFAPVAVAACFVVISATLYFRQAARTAPAPVVAAATVRNAESGRAPSGNQEQNSRESKAANEKVDREVTASLAPPHIQKAVHRVSVRAVQAREVASKGERRADVAQNTAVFSYTGAQVIHSIPVKASAEPLRVILRDESGAERVVPMRSVSFGSQDFLSRGAAPKPSAVTEVGGVW